MAIIRLQGDQEKKQGLYYEFDTKSHPLGEGGMGKVYRGRRINMHTSETRDVAIKFMFSGLPATTITRARNEANIRIQHENLVEMMGFLAVENTMPDGTKSIRYYVVSELLIGVSLSDLLQGVVADQMGNVISYAQTLYRMHNEDPYQFAVTIVKKILAGILSLHDAGYIHRDIDPSNIMITTEGKVKLIDFGIAQKNSALKTLDRNLTTAGQFMGKPQYAAPELCIGDVKNHNKSTDIYSLGIMLFQLIVGHLPFEGSAIAIQSAHIHRKMPLFLIKDKGLRKIIQKATEKDCLNRYQSAAEFRAALDSWNPMASHMSRVPVLVGGGIGVVGLIVALELLWPSSTSSSEGVSDSDTTPAVVESAPVGNINDVRKQLKNPGTAKEEFQRLQELVKADDIDDMYIMSRLYAESTSHYTLDNDIVTMQANLQGVVKSNQEEAHRLLEEIIKINPEHYKALYDLVAFYFDLRDNELHTAKALLDRAYEAPTKAEDPVYVNKINALLRFY